MTYSFGVEDGWKGRPNIWDDSGTAEFNRGESKITLKLESFKTAMELQEFIKEVSEKEFNRGYLKALETVSNSVNCTISNLQENLRGESCESFERF